MPRLFTFCCLDQRCMYISRRRTSDAMRSTKNCIALHTPSHGHVATRTRHRHIHAHMYRRTHTHTHTHVSASMHSHKGWNFDLLQQTTTSTDKAHHTGFAQGTTHWISMSPMLLSRGVAAAPAGPALAGPLFRPTTTTIVKQYQKVPRMQDFAP